MDAAPLVRISTAAPEAVLRRVLAADPELSAPRVEGARLEEAVFALTDDRGPVGCRPGQPGRHLHDRLDHPARRLPEATAAHELVRS